MLTVAVFRHWSIRFEFTYKNSQIDVLHKSENQTFEMEISEQKIEIE